MKGQTVNTDVNNFSLLHALYKQELDLKLPGVITTPSNHIREPQVRKQKVKGSIINVYIKIF